ncbi:MAG TPA: ATP-binding protein [Candidatus Magasanikbacteria bacterium]|nr:ATP-binding protein [Candidatus Magasanikbacteria bacterium]
MNFDIYSILPLTCALFVTFFGFFVLFSNYKSIVNQLLFGFCVSMFFWMFGTFMMFATRGEYYSAIFWDRFVYLGVVFMPPLMHHFSLVFTGRVGKQKKLLIANYILAIFSLAASRTALFTDDLFYYSWGVHSQARILHTVFLGYFFLGTGLFFYNVWTFFKKTKDRIVRMQSIYVFLAFATVIFIGGSAYLFAYNIDTKFPFAYVTGLIFPVMLFYAVSRHHLLGAKTVATEVLVGLTEFLVVMQLFFSRSALEIFVRAIFAVIVAFVGVLLVRSVRQEVRRREEVTHLAESLEQANIRLRELDQQKTEFLSIASHQLRTPLSILKGYIELIRDGAYGKTSKKMIGTLNDMDESNERLVKLVDEFLNITRVEQGRTKYTFDNYDINEIISSVEKELHDRAEAAKLHISFVPKHTVKKVYLDEEKIRNVIFNFVDNAIKYTESGMIKISIDEENQGVNVRVKDNGLGFGKTDQASFFQKFYRGVNVRHTNVNGTGLGLYVCRKFVEAHGGKVWAKSAGEGKGSEFGLWIPYDGTRGKKAV